MRNIYPIFVLGALFCVFAPSLNAQYEIEGGVDNNLSYRSGGIPTGPTGIPSGQPTITPQFSNVVETSGSAGPISDASALTDRYPSSGAVVLQSASIGSTFASGVPRYFLGDRIVPPESYVNASGQLVQPAADFWRAEPVRAGEIIVNPSGAKLSNTAGVAIPNTNGIIIPELAPGLYESFYYSPHAQAVFAYQPGQVEIWWRSRLPDASNNYVLKQEIFPVSSATTSPVRTLYWTEKSFNGPRVKIPSGRIETVNPVYSNVFPATVDEEFAAVGSSPPADPDAQPASELRTVWFEKTGGIGELHAYNTSGRILIEYLGELQEDGSHEFLGADVVEIAQSAPATTLTIYLGEEIRPADNDPSLIALPIDSSGTSDSVNYYGNFVRPDGSLAYYAERENTLEDRVVFYWMEELDASILPSSNLSPGLELDWPKYLHKYLQVWPDNVEDFSHYTLAQDGSSSDTGTGLKFEGGEIPTLVFQDDLEQDEAILDPLSQRLFIGLSGDQMNRSLLRFTGDNGGVWYVRLMAQAYDRDDFLEGDGGPPLDGTVYVGDRLTPPSSEYSLAGYIADGSSYSPQAYVDPFASGVTAAEKGAIIPVNAFPEGGSELKVWWFREVKAPSAEFASFYTSAKVGRYTVAYREDSPRIVLASNSGSGDLSPSQTAGFIYTQNDPTLPGFNPNEEHAMMLGGRAYALRDDLNITTGTGFTSLPRVLVQYTDPTDSRPRMEVWEVMREDETYTFDYSITAGTILNSPMPLPRLPLPMDPATGISRNTEVETVYVEEYAAGAPSTYEKFTFKDRKGYDWVYRGPHSAPDDCAGETFPDFPGPLANTEFNTAGDLEIWTRHSNIASVTVADGVYSGEIINNGDAQIFTGGLHFSADDVPWVTIRIRSSSNGNLQLFWANEQGGYGGGRSLTVHYSGSGDWQVLCIPTWNSANWVGHTTTSLRIDPPGSVGTTFSIDWIRAYRPAPLGMKWYYTMREGFNIPGISLADQPTEGTILPYLRPKNPDGSFAGNPITGTALTVGYRPVWPDNAPTMSIGETLMLPNHGLPAVRGQSSATVFYQQSIAQEGPSTPSVTLHDPTRAKSILLDAPGVGLSELPASAATTSQSGKTYFQLLPPHLQHRFYFDSNLGNVGGLMLVGEFVDEISGEDYVHLNALSSEDVTSLKSVVTSNDEYAQSWYNAVDGLTTEVETFIEDPSKPGTYIPNTELTATVGSRSLATIGSSDTAVDSYALTATGAGAGFATLLFGNGEAFTPTGEPVSVSIVKVVPQLYTGDLKLLLPSNPLDEQSVLRHSGDFAAQPGNYEFDWRYAPPQDGVAPKTYTYTMTQALGTAETNLWKLATNPSVPLPESSAYPNTENEFPRSFAIADSSYDTTSGLPGTVARAVSPLDLSEGVPAQVIFSANLGVHDGLVLYVNGIPVLASHLPADLSVPGDLPLTDPVPNLISTGLSQQFLVPPAYFAPGDNVIEVALYTTAIANAISSIDFRIDFSIAEDHVVEDGSPWIKPNGELSNVVVVGGSADSPLGNPLLVFSDNYFVMRYRARPGTDTVAGEEWSLWMEPKLVGSWIKRALDGINPFNQRNDDLFNNPVSTDVSLLTQAGPRWEGDVALNIDNINDFGLIEIYETLLNRSKNLSIDAGYDDPGTNDTLLLTAGYLNDLYMVLGDEASDDADNPTIAIDGVTGSDEVNTSRFSFEGQLSTLLDEELALLRGRDDFLSPGVTGAPAYNRLYWNYINGIDSGESIYAMNYAIKEKSDSPEADGSLDAVDAQHMFPQGHGDAYGHYLTALTGYYKLLASPHFTWTPRSEGVDVLGQTIQIDYQDERKFAAAAANVARTAARTLDLTARQSYRDDPAVGWAHQRDGKRNATTNITRHWGTDEWASRGGQGAYIHWVNANAMLPDVDDDPNHNGIQIIDRTTVPEIADIISNAVEIQAILDAQSAHLNPLGLAKGAIAFDISPTELMSGRSHFEQIYDRAIQAGLNAKAAFDQASSMNRGLRDENNSLDDYNYEIASQEASYEYELITLFGSPYPGDVGPGKLYEQGYTGPDLYHYYFINRPSMLTDTESDLTVTFREPIEMNPSTEWSLDNVYNEINDPLEYTTRTFIISPHRLMQFAPSGYGSRYQPGKIQAALLNVYEAQVNAREAADTLNGLMKQFDRDYQLFTEFRTAYDDANVGAAASLNEASANLKAALAYNASADLLEMSADFITAIGEATAEAFPITAGFAIDATSVARSLSIYGGATAAYAQQLSMLALQSKASFLELEADQLSSDADDFYAAYDWDNEDKQHVVEFELLLDEILGTGFEFSRRLAELQRANEQVASLIAQTDQILSERETFRQRAAAVIQGYRTSDMTFRTFRHEALSQYQALYDLAAQYSYLALQSYDYETGLLGTTAGQSVIDGIVSTRSLGKFINGKPVITSDGVGDGGIANQLARLNSDWSVVGSRLGINNPDDSGTLFSLRQELFRIRTDAATTEDDDAWRQALEQHIMSNLLNDPDIALYCRNLSQPDGSTVPGIVIPFSTTIEHGLNFFGLPLAAGDHAYTPSNFATKIHSTGVVFEGYRGMDPYAIGTPSAGGPASSDPNALSATPYVYLIPTGADHMLAPPLGNEGTVRTWSVKDQAIPLPFNLGQNDFSATQFFTPEGTLNEQLWILRKHQAFRPVSDPAFFYSTMPSSFTNTRLIGRSVWNSQWKLVIPAYTLLNDEQTGLDRFVRTASDIRLFFRTYSHSGN